MSSRERMHEGREGAPGAVPPGRTDVRERGEQLLARGADAIERALSMDSTTFLRTNRQQGGQ